MAGLKGLTLEQAREKLEEYGLNEIQKEKKEPAYKLLLSQFVSPIILLLIFAAIMSVVTSYYQNSSYFDGVLIIIIVLAAGIAGFVQDYKAEKAVEALRRMATPKARVIREGKEREIPSTEVVPGDLIVIEGGDVIPADAVIIQGGVEVDESMLTGESIAVKKGKGKEVYSNSSVYTGKAIARVIKTGMNTKVGEIASKMQSIKQEQTPFQNQMKKFTKKIVFFTLMIIGVTFMIGLGKFGLMEAFLIAISLAVAAVPEDLPAVITIALSLGAKEMAKKKALIRRLAVAESVGAVDVICTDKTGTLTEGKMKLEEYWFPDEGKASLEKALEVSYYCNDAEKATEENEEIEWVGDETDIALKQYSQERIEPKGKRVKEIAFSSKREMMTVIQDFNGSRIVYSKGAPEVILEKSASILFNGAEKKLTAGEKRRILQKNKEYSSKGYRVLALAFKKGSSKPEQGLTFVGLAVLSDPPRPEAAEAVRECHSAGIRVIMITGDGPLTAETIARKTSIDTPRVVTGKEIDSMTDAQLSDELRKGVNVFARTNPFHKLRILELLKEQGHVVAMTGDGVNDSLALKKADVGIAMGIKGTEVAKEASDIILLDDNFASIRNAVKSGRKIFDNIRKFVDYLLTCNTAEVVVVLASTIIFPFISLFPVQILWINLITDGLPALALSIDPARPDVMKRKPRKKNEGIINKKLAMLIGGIGLKKSVVVMATFFLVLPLGVDKARTALFTAFIMYEFVRIGVIRFNEKLDSLKDWLANKFLVASLAVSLGLQLLIIYSPLGKYFKVVPLGLYEWGVLIGGTIIGFALGILIAIAIDKITKEEY